MGFIARVKKLTSYIYSPTAPASEDAIRLQIDDASQEVYDNVQSALTSTTDGDSGMDIIGMTSIDGVMTTPQQSLEYLKGRVDATQPTLNIISVLDFGAVGDGITDNTTAFTNAINAGVKIYIPEGVFLTSNLVANKSIYMFGVGTVKAINENGNLIEVHGTLISKLSNINIFGITFIGNADKLDTTRSNCLDFEYSENVTIQNCTFQDFNIAIRFNNVENSTLNQSYISNMLETSDLINGYGLLMENCKNINVSKNKCIDIERHTFYINMGEGINISDNMIESIQAPVSSSNLEIPIKITDAKNILIKGNKFKYGLGGIQFTADLATSDPLKGAENVIIENNLFTDRVSNPGFASGYVWIRACSPNNILIQNNVFENSTDHGINIEGGNEITIRNNKIDTTSLGAGVGIRINTSTGASIPKPFVYSNYIKGYPTGIFNASTVVLTGENNRFESVTTPLNNQNGNNCFLVDSHEVGFASHVLSTNSTTPNISLGNIFTVADSSATVVTNFLGCTTGQVIHLFFTNVNTTIQNGASIKLNGGVDFVGASGKSLSLVRASVVSWYEIGRTE